MNSTANRDYIEHFTGFIDLLGFSEVAFEVDEGARLKVLNLLLSLSALRSEFEIAKVPHQTGTHYRISPTISTFSDHIVISYPLKSASEATGFDERTTAISVLFGFRDILALIASKALSIGFLVRGGATIGKLYHSGGVVFGEALVEAYQIESRTSVYPRVVVSPNVTRRPAWMDSDGAGSLMRSSDGLYCFDYFSTLIFSSAMPGDQWHENAKRWYTTVFEIIGANLTRFQTEGKLNELSKWVWFANHFRNGMESMPAELLADLGISLEAIQAL